jgi:(p)ppGpp synthase/HD superfamily hydrolase
MKQHVYVCTTLTDVCLVQVHDLLGLRVIVSPTEGSPAAADGDGGERAGEAACYRCQEVAHSFWRPLSRRSKDYIAAPKHNGYRSLHSTCTMGQAPEWRHMEDELALDLGLDHEELCKVRIELQVRTAAMNVRAEYGLAAHAAYKGGVTDPRALTDLQALMESAEEEAAERYSGLTNKMLADGAVEAEVNPQALDRLCILWSQFDKSGTGSVESEELRRVMEDLGAASYG